jgi:hypothetical protein
MYRVVPLDATFYLGLTFRSVLDSINEHRYSVQVENGEILAQSQRFVGVGSHEGCCLT